MRTATPSLREEPRFTDHHDSQREKTESLSFCRRNESFLLR